MGRVVGGSQSVRGSTTISGESSLPPWGSDIEDCPIIMPEILKVTIDAAAKSQGKVSGWKWKGGEKDHYWLQSSRRSL